MRQIAIAAAIALITFAACATVIPSGQTTDIPPTACGGTIAQAATAQNAVPASKTLHGFTIANTDPAAGGGETLWLSFTGTAAPNDPNSFPLSPPNLTFTNLASYTTPQGFGTNHAVSVYAATLGHQFSCVYW